MLDPTVKTILFTMAAYLIGSLPIGLIVCQVWAGIDIREHGSGNIGMTNIYRTLKDSHGHLPWLMTLALDFTKGYLPVHFALRVLSAGEGYVTPLYSFYIAIIAMAVICGNLFPIYIYFRGGKGVATGLGVFAAIMGVYIFIPIAIFLLLLFLSRVVSIGSIFAAVSIPVTIHIMGIQSVGLFNPERATGTPLSPPVFVMMTTIIALVIILMHRANIIRIIRGEEPRLGGSRKPAAEVSEAETDIKAEPAPDE